MLVNANVLRPPVSPVGLEYVGEALVEAGLPVHILDLSFEADRHGALDREIAAHDPSVVGLTVRNTDDCSFATRQSFLPWICELADEVRRRTDAFLLLGGAGFSVMPEAVLDLTMADGGIAGDGEEAAPELVRRLAVGEALEGIPNVILRTEQGLVRGPVAYADLERLPPPGRRLFDNQRYERLGAMVGIETKRGCPRRCIYCADPVARGSTSRLRSPEDVVQELRNLVDQGVTHFHLCDSEFNIPPDHAKEVCRALVRADLGDRIRWYTYAAPTPFDRELAGLMRRAGCGGINFGVDSLCDEQLARLSQAHRLDDVRRLADVLSSEGIDYIFDLLVGGPGETQATVRSSIDATRELGVPLAGIAVGVRVYPGTPLSRAITDGAIRQGLRGDPARDPLEPLFYVSPELGADAAALVDDLVAGDPRFLFLASPTKEGNYNYADDEALCRMIEDGARGAYWQILSRSRAQ
jgi:radical SAM superfamily enzyme YgiQ (UPF0313 family)